MHKLKLEITKFTIVGGLNAGLTFVIFFSLLEIARINYLVSLTCAWIVGVVFTYILNFVWVFKPEERLKFRKRFAKYFLSYLLSFAINLLALNFIVEKYGADPFYAQVALIPCIVVMNFLTSKLWSLRPKLEK